MPAAMFRGEVEHGQPFGHVLFQPRGQLRRHSASVYFRTKRSSNRSASWRLGALNTARRSALASSWERAGGTYCSMFSASRACPVAQNCTPPLQRCQKLPPMHFGFRQRHAGAENRPLPLRRDPHRHQQRARDHRAALPHFLVAGVHEQVRHLARADARAGMRPGPQRRLRQRESNAPHPTAPTGRISTEIRPPQHALGASGEAEKGV